jgi:hypothetical protein
MKSEPQLWAEEAKRTTGRGESFFSETEAEGQQRWAGDWP